MSRIAAGVDGFPEGRDAAALGAAIARATGAELMPRGLHERSELRLRKIGVGYDGSAESQAALGRPARPLLALSNEVDLLVIGSRRWGPAARVLLGSTGEALLHDAACPVLAVPRPAA